jgi:hypothetical protein
MSSNFHTFHPPFTIADVTTAVKELDSLVIDALRADEDPSPSEDAAARMRAADHLLSQWVTSNHFLLHRALLFFWDAMRR